MEEECLAPLLINEFKDKLVTITTINNFAVACKILDFDKSGILVENIKGKRSYIPIYNIIEIEELDNPK